MRFRRRAGTVLIAEQRWIVYARRAEVEPVGADAYTLRGGAEVVASG